MERFRRAHCALRWPLACALALILFIAGRTAVADEPLRIGLSGPFSGGSAPMGKSMRDGVRLAVEEINTYVGGVLGRRIELVELDDAANPEKGKEIAEALIEKHKVVATVGIVNTGVGLASIDTYQAARVPLLVAVSTGSELSRRYAPPASPANFVFRVSPRTEVSNAFLAEHLVKRSGVRRVGIIADDTAYGAAEKADLEKALAAHGVAPVAVERFSIGDRDMSAQLARLREAGAEAVTMFGIGPELAAIARNKAAMGWSVPLYGSWTISMRNFLDNAGSSGEGVMAVQSFIPTSRSPRHSQFVREFTQRFGAGSMESAMSAAQGYDAMRLLYSAIAHANTTDGDAIRRELENLKSAVEGVVTTYIRPFTPDDHDAITGNMLVIGKVKNGRVDYAFAEDARRSLAVRSKQAGAAR